MSSHTCRSLKQSVRIRVFNGKENKALKYVNTKKYVHMREWTVTVMIGFYWLFQRSNDTA